MSIGGKWQDLVIALVVATVVELTPWSDAFYRFVYLPLFRDVPSEDATRLAIRCVGWLFYALVTWLTIQAIRFLFETPSSS